MLRVCKACGWMHVGLTREAVEQQAREFGEFIVQQPPETQAMFGLGPLSRTGEVWEFHAHVARSERCFRCGNPYTNFRDVIDADKIPFGSTLQGIVAE